MDIQERIFAHLNSLTHQSSLPPFPADLPVEQLITHIIEKYESQLQKLLKINQNLNELFRQQEISIKSSHNLIEEKDLEISSLQSLNQKLESQIFQMAFKHKLEIDKISQERDQVQREIVKQTSVSNQISHELKKKEIEVSRFKEQLRKSIKDKDLSYKNSDGIVNNLNKELKTYQGLLDIHIGKMEFEKRLNDNFVSMCHCLNLVFESIQKCLKDLGFDIFWSKLQPVSIDLIKEEVECRLHEFECCIKDLKLNNENEQTECLKAVINEYKSIVEQKIFDLISFNK